MLNRISSRATGVPFAIAAISWLLAWVFGVYTGGEPVNGWVYDRLTRLPSAQGLPRVLLIEVDRRQWDDPATDWRKMVDSLRQHSPALIVFSRPPPGAIDLQSDGNLLLAGKRGGASGHAPLSLYPPRLLGIARSQRLFVDGQELLETAVARRLGAQLPHGTSYRPDFSLHLLPVIASKRVLSGRLVDAVVQGQVVLIGPNVEPGEGVSVPGGREFSLVRFQAWAVQSLLSGRYLRVADPLLLGGVLFLAGLLTLPLFLRLKPQRAFTLFVVLLLATLPLAWVLLWWLAWWLPVAELLFLFCTTYLPILGYQLYRREYHLHELLVAGATQLEARWVQEGVYHSPEYWDYVVALVSQILSLQRMIFLERIEGDHRVREVRALHCSLEDIGERRRDYERSPYTTAIELNGPLALDYPYLAKLDQPEQQYLVPLVYTGEVRGFWALSIDPLPDNERANFERALTEFGRQIAELLYQRNRWRERATRLDQGWHRFFGVGRGESAYTELRRLLGRLNWKMTTLEGVLDGLDTAAILYDLFGRVIQLNRRMEDLLDERQLPAYEMSGAELIARLTDRPVDEVREHLRHALLEHDDITLPVNLQNEQKLVLKIRALHQDRKYTNLALRDDEAHPFDVLGILCELVDVTPIEKTFQMKDRIVHQLGSQLRNDMEAITLAGTLVQDERLDTESRRQTSQLMQTKIASAVNKLNEVTEFLSADLDSGTIARYPIDVRLALEAALEVAAPGIEEHGLSVELEQPAFPCLAFAAPGELERLLEALLGVLVNDATLDSQLTIDLQAGEQQVVITLSNQGFGLPNKRLREYLAGSEELSSNEFLAVRNIARGMPRWGGSLRADSEVGTGMQFVIQLEAYR